MAGSRAADDARSPRRSLAVRSAAPWRRPRDPDAASHAPRRAPFGTRSPRRCGVEVRSAGDNVGYRTGRHRSARRGGRLRAHPRAGPYSGFKVGAALETSDGDVLTGCNVENATYGLTLCAERVALVKALSEGHTVFTRVVVVADTENPTPPCGSCRQLLWEYCGDIEVDPRQSGTDHCHDAVVGAAAAAVRRQAARIKLWPHTLPNAARGHQQDALNDQKLRRY